MILLAGRICRIRREAVLRMSSAVVAEPLHLRRELPRHLVAVEFLEHSLADRAAAAPVVARTAGDRRIPLGQGIVRLVPEEAVGLDFPGKLLAEVEKVVAERLRVETARRQRFAGERRNLPVPRIVRQEQARRLAAEPLSNPPGVKIHLQPHLLAGLGDGLDVGEPEIQIEFRKGQQDRRAVVVEHLLEVAPGVFHVSRAIIADACLLNCHSLLSHR